MKVDFKRTDRPFVIAGPCSAESESQLASFAKSIDSSKIDVIRAGIWKPRTRPDSFEGMGSVALPWLKQAGQLAKLPVATEVANSEHVEASLKAGIDILWIGARTTVNPFSVQEIADSLKGVDIPVVIKNPLNPDLQLWIGAVERLKHAGIGQLAVLHRGFSFYGKSNYRNKPMWEIPIAMRTHFPEIPMLCDPSHINGKREGLGEIAQKAIDLGMDGLMLESHPCPAEALSDAKQQIIPSELKLLLNNLIWRREDILDPAVISKLGKLRAEVDTLDEEIARFLSARMELTDAIGDYKKEHGLTILQLERWKEVIDLYDKALKPANVSTSFIKNFLENLHEESIRRQTEVVNKERKEAQSKGVFW